MLRCEIRFERPVEKLASSRSAFGFLRDCVPSPAHATAWNRGDTTSVDIGVVAVGKTGYGKSTSLNALLGVRAFATSDTSGCTRTMQSVEYRFAGTNTAHYFSFSDLPGIGENLKLDREYMALYREALGTAQVVLYFVRADQRDFSIDQRVFDELIGKSDVKNKVILVVNAIDKIEPLNRRLPFAPNRAQLEALREKIDYLSVMFGIGTDDIIPIAGATGFNLDALASAIARRVGPYVGASRQTVARLPVASRAQLQTIAEFLPSSLYPAARAAAEQAGDTSLSATLAHLGFLAASAGAFSQQD